MLFQNIISGKSSLFTFATGFLRLLLPCLLETITNKKCVEMTAILTLSCTVKYSTHLKALLLRFHSVLAREIDLEEGPGGDRAAVNLNGTARCPQTGGG